MKARSLDNYTNKFPSNYILADIFSDILNNYQERISKKTMKRMMILQEKTDARI